MTTTQAKVDELFEQLIPLLDNTLLLTGRGFYRFATADEFMFMGTDEKGNHQFKHSHTKNYVFIRDGKLIVPRTNQAFLLGFFDSP